MKKKDVVAKVSEKSGITADICEKITDAFEAQAEDSLFRAWKTQ